MGASIQRNPATGGDITVQTFKMEAAEEAVENLAKQVETQRDMQLTLEEATNPFARGGAEKLKKIQTNKTRVQKMLQTGEKSARLLPIEQIKDSANQFQRRNQELQAKTLVALRELIKPGDSKEEILRKVLEFYPDVSLADEALEFLLETTEGALANEVREAKETLNEEKQREIAAGRNVTAQARQAAEKGLGTPSNLREMYRDITGNPRDSTTLFEELSNKYAFKDLKKVTDFLLHSLGADMKAKGPSIPRAELHRLITETRSLQAILGVYRFFKGRMRLLTSLFSKNGLSMPQQLSFESMAKQFMQLAADRYPSAAKVLVMAGRLGIEDWILAKIFVLSQMRDAVREVAMALIYKTLQHRDELYLAILEALEDLEDELEEMEEKEREKEEEEEEEEGEEEDEDQ
jgi:type III secretion protein W